MQIVAPEPAPVVAMAQRGPRVLLLGGDVHERSVIEAFASRKGFAIENASTMPIIHQTDVDVAVVRVRAGDDGAHDALAELRVFSGDTAILALVDTAADGVRAYGSGACKVVLAPTDLDLLCCAIDALADRAPVARQAFASG